MNDLLSKSHIKILKVILSIWPVVVTAVTLSTTLVFVSKGGYNHPIVLFACILAITSYINTCRFFSMVYDNNRQISLLQLKIWAMMFVRGIFVSCLYLAIYVKNIWGIIFFALTQFRNILLQSLLNKGWKEWEVKK